MSRSRSPMTSSMRRDRSYSPYDNKSGQEENGCRIHVADLSSTCTKQDIEKAFEKWPIMEVWHAQASCFAFVVLRHRHDGQQAISELDGRCIGEARVRVSFARPRTHGGSRRKHFDPNMRCYQCGSRGHFSRDCGNNQRNGHKYRSHSRERRRKRSYSRSRSRSPRSRRVAPSSSSSTYQSGYYTSPPRI